MRRMFAKRLFAALAATLVVTGGAVSAQYGSHGGEFVVGSQVISDEVAAPSGYVGDIGAVDAGCADGSCGDAGGCASGDCGSCADGKCGSGSVGSGSAGSGGLLGGLFGSRGDRVSAGCQERKYDHSDLFYNFYSQGNCNQANAQMYVSPLPVPPFVGHTFYTYQPFNPHEYLYWHKNRFHNNYDNGRGMNRTKAVYYAPPVRTAMSNLYWNKIRLPR